MYRGRLWINRLAREAVVRPHTRVILCSRSAALSIDHEVADRENCVAERVNLSGCQTSIRLNIICRCDGILRLRSDDGLQSDCRAAFTVFAISIAMVIGPTPPGTGVIALAFFDTSSNATSPTRR